MKHVRLGWHDRTPRGQFTWWSTAAHQNVNFVNSGITVTF
jgi:hypothetical protein